MNNMNMKLSFLKKIIIVVLFIGVISCDKGDSEEYCWVFSTKMVTSVSPSTGGYPQTVTSQTTQCGLTEMEADEVVEKLTTTSRSTSNGYTVTIKTTVTKRKTTDKPGTGQHVPI